MTQKISSPALVLVAGRNKSVDSDDHSCDLLKSSYKPPDTVCKEAWAVVQKFIYAKSPRALEFTYLSILIDWRLWGRSCIAVLISLNCFNRMTRWAAILTTTWRGMILCCGKPAKVTSQQSSWLRSNLSTRWPCERPRRNFIIGHGLCVVYIVLGHKLQKT